MSTLKPYELFFICLCVICTQAYTVRSYADDSDEDPQDRRIIPRDGEISFNSSFSLFAIF